MTGLSFKAIQYGPVPNRWDRVYSLIDDINLIEVEGKNGNVGNKLVSDMPCDISSFSNEQLSILETVYDTFKNDNSVSISNKPPGTMDEQSRNSLIHRFQICVFIESDLNEQVSL